MSKPEIILVCGSGGVGKTTTAAALGVSCALAGKSALVMTVDPAKRLATSLGLKSLRHEPQRIHVRGTSAPHFDAMMLDSKNFFDDLILKYSRNPEQAQAVLKNRLYQNMSRMLAGTQEYMAMEQLYDVWQRKAYDVYIVDTPPMQHAIDFLTAPQRLANMLNHSMLTLLLKPAVKIGRSGFKFLEAGARKVLAVFGDIAGMEFLQDVSEMLVALQGLFGGFKERAQDIQALLTSSSARFVVVGAAERQSIHELTGFCKWADEHGYIISDAIINRVCVGDIYSERKLREAQTKLATAIGSERSAQMIIEHYRHLQPLMHTHSQLLDALRASKIVPSVLAVPLFHSDIHQLNQLEELALHVRGLI